MINLGLIGCGYWGPNLLRNFYNHPDCQIQLVADTSPSRLDYVKKNYPSIDTTADYKDLLDSGIDAVVIATPAQTHYALVKEMLKAGKHVLVEKPLAMTVKEGDELVKLARKVRKKLMVGHTFEYNAAVQKLKQLIKKGEVGKPYYLYSQRLNLGIVRQDINALWNLAPHDISIILYLLEAMPISVSAKGHDVFQNGNEDVVFLIMHFPQDIMAHVQVSWLDPSKVRRMTVVGSEKMVIYDDVSDAKIQIYDKGIRKQNITDSLGAFDDFGKFQLIKTAGDVVHPKINFVEPLKTECAHFIECIEKNKEPQTDGENGLRVVRVLEAAQKSMRANGKNVKV